jgi:hypothetical protein
MNEHDAPQLPQVEGADIVNPYAPKTSKATVNFSCTGARL